MPKLSHGFLQRFSIWSVFCVLVTCAGANQAAAVDTCAQCRSTCKGACWSNDSGATCFCFEPLPYPTGPPLEPIPECDDAVLCTPPSIPAANGSGVFLKLSAKLVKSFARCQATAIKGKADRTDLAACEAKALAKHAKAVDKLRGKGIVPPGVACGVDSSAAFEVAGWAAALVRASAAAAAICPSDCVTVCSGATSVECASDADCLGMGLCGVQICP